MTQKEFNLFQPQPEDPNVAWLVDLLDRRKVWLTAKEIVTLSGDILDDRQVRALAKAACPRIISGQKGYKHTKAATIDEIRRFRDWMVSQAIEMQDRAIAVERYAHAVTG